MQTRQSRVLLQDALPEPQLQKLRERLTPSLRARNETKFIATSALGGKPVLSCPLRSFASSACDLYRTSGPMQRNSVQSKSA